MAKRYPGARWEPLGNPSDESRMTSHDLICIHTMVGTLEGTDTFFEHDGFGGTESHFGTGGLGECIQWQDLAFSADANLDGGHRVISIENADMGEPFVRWSGSNVPPFSTPQMARLVDLVAWLCSKEAHADCPSSWKCHQVGIPPVFVPDSKPGRRGVCVHRQGIDGNFPDHPLLRGRVPGGERWSTSTGKACPGDRRILQTANEIVPAVKARLNEEEPMTKEERELLEQVARDQKTILKRLNADSAIRRLLQRLVKAGAATRADVEESKAILERLDEADGA